MKTLIMENDKGKNLDTSRLIENMFRLILMPIIERILNKETFDVLFGYCPTFVIEGQN